MARAIDKTIDVRTSSSLGGRLADYAQLFKVRLSLLVVFSAGIGYLVAGGMIQNFAAFISLILGGMLVTGASNTINQILEKDTDALMERTAGRPLAAKRMKVGEAAVLAGLSGVVGIALLTLVFNPVAGVLAALSLMLYGFLYTPLKRISSIAVFVGAIPGALPPMIGYVSVTGQIDFAAILLFTLQFFWQFPHFWAIAWLKHEDYLKAGIMLLPSKDGRSAALINLIYTSMLLPLGVIMYLTGVIGLTGATVVTIAGVIMTYYGVMFVVRNNDVSARGLLFSSFFYLPVALLAILIDKI